MQKRKPALSNLSTESPAFFPTGLRVHSGLRAGKPLGDVLEDITHATGLVRLAELYTIVTGKDCGCKGRQGWLNRVFPH
ncbi:MAG: hypothetical protein NT121_01155, partial [Chloroflexi bacterium]|nr:hypothetical protein [Chloroflexota bacterium]